MAAKTDPNYWMGMLNSPMGQQLAMEGADALESGEVTMDQVSPLLKVAGYGPRKKSPLDVTLRRRPQVNQVARGSGLTASDQVKASQSDTNTNKAEGKDQALTFMSPDQLQGLYDQTAQMPAFQDQARGIASQRELMGLAAQAPSDIYSGPLAGLLQAEFGRNTGTMAQMAGETPAQKRANILAMGGKLQDDREGLSKSIFDAIGKQRAGYSLNTLGEVVQLKNALENTQAVKAEDPKKFEKAAKSGKPYDITRDLEKHQKRMEGLEALRSSYELLDEQVGGFDKWTPKKDIAGVGQTGWLPSALLSSAGSDNKEMIADLRDQVLKLRSGGQVTGSEAARLLQSLGVAKSGGDREFIRGMKTFGINMKAALKQREAAIRGAPQGEKVLQAYQEGGGTRSDSFVPPTERKKLVPPKKPLTFEEWKAAGKPKAGG